MRPYSLDQYQKIFLYIWGPLTHFIKGVKNQFNIFQQLLNKPRLALILGHPILLGRNLIDFLKYLSPLNNILWKSRHFLMKQAKKTCYNIMYLDIFLVLNQVNLQLYLIILCSLENHCMKTELFHFLDLFLEPHRSSTLHHLYLPFRNFLRLIIRVYLCSMKNNRWIMCLIFLLLYFHFHAPLIFNLVLYFYIIKNN